MTTRSNIEVQDNWTLVQSEAGYAYINQGNVIFSLVEKDVNGVVYPPTQDGSYHVAGSSAYAVPDNHALFARTIKEGYTAIVSPTY